MKTITFLFLLVFATATMAQVPGYVPGTGLAGWWPFNGNPDDESGNGNNGTVHGTVLLVPDRIGSPASAYSFPGNDSSNISTDFFGILGTSPRTVSFWAKTNLADNLFPVCYGGITSLARGSHFNCPLNYNTTGVTADIGNAAITYAGTSPVDDNQWHHYVWILDSIVSPKLSDVKVYQDGNYLDQILQSFAPTASLNTLEGQKLIFGHDPWGTRHFNGSIDDVGIWSRALTQQEITSLYNGIHFGTNEQTCAVQFNIYPNPASDHIVVKVNKNLIGSCYSIIDQLGKTVMSGKLSSEISNIELVNLSECIYLLKVGDDAKQTLKLIKN